MSFMIFQVKCDKCYKIATTSFGMVGSSIIAESVQNCKCGGRFRKVNNKVGHTEVKIPFYRYNTLEEMCDEMAVLLKGCNSHTCSVCETCGDAVIKLLDKYKKFKGGH